MDNFLFAGSQQLHNTAIDHLRAQFQLNKESLNHMIYIYILYTGIEYSQAHDEKIIIHQTEYTAKMEPLCLTNMSKNCALDALEVRQFNSLVGQLQWTAKQTHPATKSKMPPQLMFVVLISRYGNYKLNLVLYVSQTLVMCVKVLNLYVYSDVSFANLAGRSSQGGYVIFLKAENGKASPLVWTSNKLKRVVKSPKAAETLFMQLTAVSMHFFSNPF